MSPIVRLFSRARIRSRSSAPSLWSRSYALRVRTSTPACSRSRSAMASASSRSSATPAGVHTPTRRSSPRCRDCRMMSTKSCLARIVPQCWQPVRTARSTRSAGEYRDSLSIHRRRNSRDPFPEGEFQGGGESACGPPPQAAPRMLSCSSPSGTARVPLSRAVPPLRRFEFSAPGRGLLTRVRWRLTSTQRVTFMPTTTAVSW